MTSKRALQPAAEKPTLSAWLTTGWRNIYEKIVAQDDLDLILRMTLLSLVVFQHTQWYGRIYVVIFCTCAVVHLPLLRSSIFWLLLGLFQFADSVLVNWSTAMNSSFVISYWCFAIACSLQLPDPRRAIMLSAKWLIALVFLFAAAWKLSSPEYLSGSMFYNLFYLDNRFFEAVRPFEGLYGDSFFEDSVAARRSLAELRPVISIQYDAGLNALAHFLTWWTVILEAAIGILFLCPDKPAVVKWRNVLLILFIATTYPPTRLIVFAWLISLVGFSQCPEQYRRIRFSYLVLLVGSTLFLGGYLQYIVSRYVF